MARHSLTGADLPPAAREPVRAYLAEVASHLPAPARRPGAPLLAELAGGLADAVAARTSAGLSPVAAADAAAAEFGDPAALAEAFAADIAAAHSRRTALALVRTGPLVGGLWLAALVASPATAGAVVGPPWRRGLTGVWAAFPLVALIVAAFVLAAVVVLASTGRPSRWLPPRPRLAPTAAATATALCVACDLTVLAILAGQAAAAPHSVAWGPVAAALAASLTRFAFASRATRRCLALRAALT